MINILLAFVTGLTTGGLSCLAVQGGLLASSLATQVESDLRAAAPRERKKRPAAAAATPVPAMAAPILAFLAAKLLAYTLLGFLLGALGQMFQLSPMARAFLLIAIGIFMLGTALRMLNVHPIFRYFAFEPPAFLRRKLRRAAKGSGERSLATPVFLGLLTVLIPCGVTQAMMAAALGSGSPVEGAALMFAFTLGASPVFFAVAYFATRLGARLEKHFMRFVAVVVLVLAVVTIDSGLTLAGSPVSLARFLNNRAPSAAAVPPAADPGAAAPAKPGALQPYSVEQAVPPAAPSDEITIYVENYGYNPEVVYAKAGAPITLHLITDNTRSCSRAFVIPALGKELILPATGDEVVQIPAQEKGTEMLFSCSMGMYSGTIVFD